MSGSFRAVGKTRQAGALSVPIVVLAALVAASSAFGGDGIRTFGTCNVFAPDPDRNCAQGNPWGAVLISNRGPIKYKLCVRRPGGNRDCYRKKAREGKESTVGFFGPTSPHTIGTYHFTWKSGGRVLDKDQLHLHSEGV